MADTTIMKISGICKSFPGVKVLDDINMHFERGKVHALLGENGAGKSTLMNILFGYYHEDEGFLEWKGEKVRIVSPVEAQAMKIAMIHQENSLIPYLSVAYNIFLGHYPKKGGFIDRKKLKEDTQALLDELKIKNIKPETRVDKLSVAQKQLVEIAKALSIHPEFLLMDEPTAALTEEEVDTLLHIVDTLKKDNVAILYVSHRMEEVFGIADTITVLRDGKLIKTCDRNDITSQKAIELMVGRDLSEQLSEVRERDALEISDEVALKVKDFSKKNCFSNISFEVKKGEILGFGGLVGAGRSELMEAIFGYNPPDSGEIELFGKKTVINATHVAIANNIALVPEERKVKGLFQMLSVADNINMVSYKRFLKKGLISRKKEESAADEYIEKFSIKTSSRNKKIGDLSGGNQQKAILARWLQTRPEILILDEPTHGIDIGAKAEIYKMIRQLAAEGITILLITSELPELLMLCDRIVVMYHGKVTGILNKDEFSEQRVMTFATNQNNRMV